MPRPYLLLLLALVSVPLIAQHPLPGSVSGPPVICTVCEIPYTNLPTWRYDAPITGFAGRYLDSTFVRLIQRPVRTYRASKLAIVPELDRVFMIVGGGTFATYELSTFLDTQLGSPLATAPNGERFLPFFSSVYPESSGSGWMTINLDGQDRLAGFDWDERGFRYLAYSVFGWGIVRDDGSLVAQVFGESLLPEAIVAFGDGANHYVAVSNWGTATAIWEVTDPETPVFIRTMPFSFRNFAKVSNGSADTVALVDGPGVLRIWNAADLASGGAPAAEVDPVPGFRFTDVTTDGLRFLALQSSSALGSTTSLSVLATENGVWAESISPVPDAGRADTVSFDAGILTVTGRDFAPSFSPYLRIYRLAGNAAELIDLGGYFEKYYTAPPAGYAAPNHTTQFHDGATTVRNGIRYVFAAANGLGDVYRVGVTTNEAPVLQPIAADPIPVGTEIRFALTATDPEGSILRFHAIGLPAGSTLDPATGEFVWTPTPGQIGDHPVRFGVADPDGGVAWQDVALLVPPPAASIGAAAMLEGPAGTTSLVQLVVTLSTPSASEVRIDWSTADQTATAGVDYLAANGTLVFAPGETSSMIDLTILGDDELEPDETFEVVLDAPDGATLQSDRAIVTILNDEPVPVPLSPWLLGAIVLALGGVALIRVRA